MKIIWPAEKVYEYLCDRHYPVPIEAYCTKHFSWRELLIRQNDRPELFVLENLERITQLLQKYRITIFKNSPVIITSGWRSEYYNKKIGGAAKSYHISGKALDFVVVNMSPAKVQRLLDKVHEGGLEFAPSWTHIDIRQEKARFYP